MIHYIDESILANWDAGQDDAAWGQQEDEALTAWDAEMISRGMLVGGGVLRPGNQTTTLQVRDGELLVTDGPFAETKEQIAGFDLIECADLDQAIEVASKHPVARFGALQVRPYI